MDRTKPISYGGDKWVEPGPGGKLKVRIPAGATSVVELVDALGNVLAYLDVTADKPGWYLWDGNSHYSVVFAGDSIANLTWTLPIAYPAGTYALNVTNAGQIASIKYTPLNEVSTIVQRDASGDFAAGTITATIIVTTQSIADNAVVTVDDVAAADNEYAKFTAIGVEGRDYSEVRGDLGVLPSIDEDNMVSNSDVHVPTQQSTKAYVDTHAADTSTHGAADIADVSDIAVDANLSVAAQAAIGASHAQGTDTALGVVGVKNPPIDADLALYRDSAAGNVLVTSTWTQVKAFLKTYFDTLYGGFTWSVKTVAFNVATRNGYVVDTLTTGAVTATLPAAPAVGDYAMFTDGASSFDVANLTIARNALNIMGLAEDMTVNTKNAAFGLVYESAALGWRLF